MPASHVLLALVAAANAFSCLNQEGKFADHWTALKVNNGAEYYYRDDSAEFSTEYSGTFKPGGTMADVPGAPGAILSTIGQLYGLGTAGGPVNQYAYALYNDETPDGKTSSSHAHSKGVVLFDGTSGFWLVHSFPKWPAFPTYAGLSSDTYGQSFFCMSFRASELEKIAAIQALQGPLVYASGVSQDLVGRFPAFETWIADEHKQCAANKATTNLTSVRGRTFTHYGKSAACACDLWEDVVAPGVGAGLRVESWQNGPIDLKMPTFCPPKYAYAVQNISEIVMADGTSWRETQDHSKWGVSTKAGRTACVGDINRQTSQAKRGGGAVCFTDDDHWAAFDGIVKKAFLCPVE